jgi:hypothetical protein
MLMMIVRSYCNKNVKSVKIHPATTVLFHHHQSRPMSLSIDAPRKSFFSAGACNKFKLNNNDMTEH